MRYWIVTTLSLILMLTGLSATASEPKKIGLALSGGGARGIAHVGVLRALDELRVPVDFVAGTSMGSIVGGLYATGRSPDQLQTLVEGIDWDQALAARTEHRYLKFRDKYERRTYNLALEFGLGKDGIAPGGVIAGHNLQLVLRRLTGILQTWSFDDLAIPFRAVATDIQRGEPYAIGQGDLATALRASMAVPLVFDPVELDGRVLVDGGVLNNLPVDVARQMGADLVIAVNIASPLGEVSASSSFVNVAYQSIDVALVRNTIESLAEADLVIAPELGDYSAADFENATTLIQAGYDAVMAKRVFLEAIALSDAAYAEHQSARPKPTIVNERPIAYVEFQGNSRTAARRLHGIADQLIGQSVQLPAIEEATRQMMALNSFQSIGYEFVQNRQGLQGLRFLIKEKAWGPDYLRFGIELAADLELEAEPSLRLRHRRLNTNPYGGEWLNDLELGTDYALRSEFFQPIGFDAPWFISAYGSGSQRLQRVFDATGQRELAQFDLTRYRGGLDVGLSWTVAELRLGAFGGQYRSNVAVGEGGSPSFDDNEGGWRVALGIDTQERDVFANSGWLLDANAEIQTEGLGAEVDYERYEFDATWRYPIGNGAFHLQLLGRWIDGEVTDSAFVSLGGIDDFAGYASDALIGHRAALLRIGGFGRIPNLELPLIGAPRVVGLLHAGQVWQRGEPNRFDDLQYGLLAGLSIDLLGTSAFFGTGYSEEIDDARYYLHLGNLF